MVLVIIINEKNVNLIFLVFYKRPFSQMIVSKFFAKNEAKNSAKKKKNNDVIIYVQFFISNLLETLLIVRVSIRIIWRMHRIVWNDVFMGRNTSAVQTMLK